MAELEAPREEERRVLRPYRRVVGTIYGLAIATASVLILRGIIGALMALPSAGPLTKPEHVDRRTLRTCRDDLELLESNVRRKAGEALARAEEAAWPDTSAALDHQLQRIVARCRLDEPSEDPAVAELRAAVTAISDLRLDYDLLHARHEGEARQHAREAKEALDRARNALRGN